MPLKHSWLRLDLKSLARHVIGMQIEFKGFRAPWPACFHKAGFIVRMA